MLTFTVRFHAFAECAQVKINASDPAAALARARLLAETQTGLVFERHEERRDIENIQVIGKNGDVAIEWISPSLLLELAAPSLLEAAKLVIARWSDGDLADAVRQLDAAVAEAEG